MLRFIKLAAASFRRPQNIFLFALLIAIGVSIFPFQYVSAEGSVYYVDSFHGADSNTGLSAGHAWRSLKKISDSTFEPGDKILFDAGGVWLGMLSPQGSGTAKSPIIIDVYGTGPRPEIVGDGQKAALLLHNQQYWDIKGLSISNSASTPGDRNGILVEADTPRKTFQHIHLTDLVVRDVTGHLGADIASKNTGGIGFYAAGKNSGTTFEDIAVEHCLIENSDSTGIWIDSQSGAHPRSATWNTDHNENVRLIGNTFTNIGKNSIIVRSSNAPLIQKNVITGSAAHFHGNAIVIFSSKNALVEQNVVSGTHYYGLEGAAYDSDYNSEGTVIEYNVSYNNGGGLVDLCSNPEERKPRGYNDGTIVRYNISQNDIHRVFGFDGPVTNTQIYNNSVYVGKGLSPHIVDFDLFGKYPGYADHTEFRNNVIDNEGNGNYKWSGGTNYQFEANTYLGIIPANAPSDSKAIKAGPGFYSVPTNNLSMETLSGYALADNAPGLSSGVVISNNGGQDIVGTPLPASAPDRGAIQSSTLAYRLIGAVPYAQEGGEVLVTDLYIPKSKGPYPAILFLHGGGWSGGNRLQLRRQAAYMAGRGFLGMAIEYRLDPKYHFPAPVHDAKEAVRWLRAHAAQYNIDPTHIGVVGSSAGGHLAAMLGVTNGDKQFEGSGCCQTFSSSVQAVVSFNGIYDLTAMSHRASMVEHFLGVTCDADLKLCKAASPINHVTPNAPPFLIMHGTADQTAPYAQAKAMVDALNAAGTQAEMFTAPGAPHTFWAEKQWYEPSRDAMAAFLEKWLRSNGSPIATRPYSKRGVLK